MSAFICSDYHISYIVKAGIKYKAWLKFGDTYGYLTPAKAQHVFEVLQRENQRSVGVRYKEDGRDPVGQFDRTVGGIAPVQTLKAIGCLDYQSCETETWGTSLANEYLRAIEHSAIRELPGYEAAQGEVKDAARAALDNNYNNK